MCNPVNLRPPEFLSIDEASSNRSKEIQSNFDADGVNLIESPVENPSKLRTVERNHAPLCTDFSKIKAGLLTNTTDAESLRTYFHAVNSTVVPEGLCPPLWVFGVLSPPAHAIQCGTQHDPSKIIDAGMVEGER